MNMKITQVSPKYVAWHCLQNSRIKDQETETGYMALWTGFMVSEKRVEHDLKIAI